MLKFIFFCLLAANVLLLAFGQGYLGHFSGNEREPARMKNQLNADQMVLLSPASAIAKAAASVTTAAAVAPAAVLACTEVGNFSQADARRFETAAEALQLGDRQSRHNVAGQDISSYIVFIPSQGSKEASERKTAELKQLGVTNFFVIPDNTPMRGAISLGVFKTEAAAQTLLASLVKQGVHSARVGPRYSASKLLAYQFRDLDAASKGRLDDITATFTGLETRRCK